jgi:hypothetical protein
MDSTSASDGHDIRFDKIRVYLELKEYFVKFKNTMFHNEKIHFTNYRNFVAMQRHYIKKVR